MSGRNCTRQCGDPADERAYKNRTVTFERVGRSYSRTVARVWLGGRDLAGMLVEVGIAKWWPRGSAKPDWCSG